MGEVSGPDARPAIDGFVALEMPPAIGRTARVYRAIRLSDGASVAIKVLTTSVEQGEFLEEAFRRETASLGELRHPNIVRMHASGIATDGRRYIVLDWIDSDLPRWKAAAGPFAWDRFWQTVGRPLVSAVAHAHSRNIAHRDLAPRNILFSSDGRPMVADFGIAKLRRFMRTEQTLRDFSSPPFTPREADDGADTMARDVFSLATLICWCASPVELTGYSEVHAFAESSDVFPAAIRDLLLQSLSEQPEDRPSLAEEFLDRADAAMSTRPSSSSALSCLLTLGLTQAGRIGRSFGLTERGATEAAILDDLGSLCGIEPRVDAGGAEPSAFGDLWLYGLTHSYHARPDSTADRLVILAASAKPPGWLEARRQQAVSPRIDFRFLPRGREADKLALSRVQQIVDEHLYARAEAETEGENWQIEVWSRILEAKQELELGRERPIRYRGFSIDGRRVRFHTLGDIPEGATLEKRQVRLQDGSFLTGLIEGFDGQDAIFVVEKGETGLLRTDGEIAVNIYAASEAIRRQQRALDAFRTRSTARPALADVLLDPPTAAPITAELPKRWFQEELDSDKQTAVAAALASRDAMLLRGPPGTGKTTFIAELILQELARNPQVRILLASQTHVAIDNAIERVAELRDEADLTFEIVRIGTNEERISENVEPHRLHRRLQAWTAEVSQKVAAYAEGKAAARGVERSTVLISMALEQLVSCERDVRTSGERIRQVEKELEALPNGRKQDDGSALDLDVAGNAAARRLELAQLRERQRSAEREEERLRGEIAELGAPDMATMRGTELTTAFNLYFDDASVADDLRPLIELGAEWTARFGRQDHFEGPFLSTVQVLAGTCIGVVGSKSSNELEFDLCIVDEASKATPTEMLVPLSRASRWILVGDSKQLPPFQDAAMRSPGVLEQHDLRREDLAESLFGHLERRLPSGNVLSLTSQRRMIRPINDLVQACFYPDQELVCRRSGPKVKLGPALKHAVTWIDTSRLARRRETVPASGNGCFNKLECELVNNLLRKLDNQFARRDPRREQPRVTVAVITGYADQARMLERTLRPRSPSWTHVEIMLNTVDAFQGRQADMVVYSVARSNPENRLGFLDEPPRLNVALSRGKDAMVIVGDRSFCNEITGENPFRKVIRHIDVSEGCMVEEIE